MNQNLKNGKIVGKGIQYEDYHQQAAGVERGHPLFVMSRSELLEFDYCPARWLKGVEEEETDSTTFGSLVDCLVTDAAMFQKRYAVHPDTYQAEVGNKRDGYHIVDKKWNRRAKYCEEWEADAEDRKMVPISQSDCNEATQAFRNVAADKDSALFLSHCDFQVMITAQYIDPETGYVIPLRCLIDLLPRKGTPPDYAAGDFKTARSIDHKAFGRQVEFLGYDVQGALTLDIINAAEPMRNEWRFILVENKPPFTVGRRYLSEPYLEHGRAVYKRALRNYCQCLAAGKWPDFEEMPPPGATKLNGFTSVDPELWMIQQWQL